MCSPLNSMTSMKISRMYGAFFSTDRSMSRAISSRSSGNSGPLEELLELVLGIGQQLPVLSR